jgi:hypothetical protein
MTSLAGISLFCLPRRRRFTNLLAILIVASVVSGVVGCGSSGVKPTAMALTSSSTKVASGTSLTFQTSVVSSNSLKGTVPFYDGSTAISGGIMPVNGVASLTTSALGVGTQAITAKYTGDGANGPSQSSDVLEQTITGTFALVVNATSGSLTHPMNLTATLQ